MPSTPLGTPFRMLFTVPGNQLLPQISPEMSIQPFGLSEKLTLAYVLLFSALLCIIAVHDFALYLLTIIMLLSISH